MAEDIVVHPEEPTLELLLHAGGSAVELAIGAWLDAKSKRSGSVKTARAYQDTLSAFRKLLQAQGLDLDGHTSAVALLA